MAAMLPAIRCRFIVSRTDGHVALIDLVAGVAHHSPTILLLLIGIVVDDGRVVTNLVIVARAERARVRRAIPLQLPVNLDLARIAWLIDIAGAWLLGHETDNIGVDTGCIRVKLLLLGSCWTTSAILVAASFGLDHRGGARGRIFIRRPPFNYCHFRLQVQTV